MPAKKDVVPGKWQYVRKEYKDGGNHDYNTKVKVVSTYLATGNLALTSRLCEVPLKTITKWKTTSWWVEMINDLQIQEKVDSNKTLKRIREKALNVVMDRLENGNCQYDNKTGRVVRVPVNARDAHKIASDFIDKEDLLQDRILQLNKQADKKSSDVLKQMAAAFEAMAKGKKVEFQSPDSEEQESPDGDENA